MAEKEKLRDLKGRMSKYAQKVERKGGRIVYSAQYQTWRANPSPHNAQKHREMIEHQFGLLAKVRPVRQFFEEEQEYLEAAE